MTFDWWTFALQAINFLVLVWLLQRFLYKPVAGIIEKRRKHSNEVMQEAEQAKTEAEAAKQDFEHRVQGLDQKRQRILDDAQTQISEERRKVADEARREAEELIAAARDEIEKDKAAALQTMRGQIADLAADMAAKLLSDSAPKVPDDVFLKAISEKIGALPKKEGDRLRKSLAADAAALTVVTARPLGRAAQSKWHKALDTSLGGSVKTTFENDPGLIGGAELRFPDAVIRYTWSDQLGRLTEQLIADGKSS